ncbi:hypothetical protein BU17DRAFT_45765 [Hysterangium stoloniferum]|nr:hypothetical protein BU17DRAFT_45765 [Hysterangium stoloniferum]
MEWLRSNVVSLYRLGKAEEKNIIPISVNYFPHRRCNYACEFCFHTSLNLEILPLEEAKRGLRLLADAGMKKLNISGGEPFLKPTFIGEVFRFCKEELGLESCSIVNNGSKVTEKWLDTYGQYLDMMAISCDSFDPETNVRIGRADKAGNKDHISTVFKVAQWYNWEEDMNENIEALSPTRWKVFQVLLLEGENTGKETNSLRDGRDLVISKEQFEAFLDRHKVQKSLVPEDNEAMKDSYLLLDENMRQTGRKVPGRSLLQVGVQEALKDSGWDEKTFHDRGGVFDWSRKKDDKDRDNLSW